MKVPKLPGYEVVQRVYEVTFEVAGDCSRCEVVMGAMLDQFVGETYSESSGRACNGDNGRSLIKREKYSVKDQNAFFGRGRLPSLREH